MNPGNRVSQEKSTLPPVLCKISYNMYVIVMIIVLLVSHRAGFETLPERKTGLPSNNSSLVPTSP